MKPYCSHNSTNRMIWTFFNLSKRSSANQRQAAAIAAIAWRTYNEAAISSSSVSSLRSSVSHSSIGAILLPLPPR
jgi:hypothetical protein